MQVSTITFLHVFTLMRDLRKALIALSEHRLQCVACGKLFLRGLIGLEAGR